MQVIHRDICIVSYRNGGAGWLDTRCWSTRRWRGKRRWRCWEMRWWRRRARWARTSGRTWRRQRRSASAAASRRCRRDGSCSTGCDGRRRTLPDQARCTTTTVQSVQFSYIAIGRVRPSVCLSVRTRSVCHRSSTVPNSARPGAMYNYKQRKPTIDLYYCKKLKTLKRLV